MKYNWCSLWFKRDENKKRKRAQNRFYNNRYTTLLTVRSVRVPVTFGICAMIEDDDDDSDGLDGDDDEIDDEIETLSNGDGSNNNKVITHIEYNMIFEFCKKTKTNSVRKCYAMLKMRVYYFPF